MVSGRMLNNSVRLEQMLRVLLGVFKFLAHLAHLIVRSPVLFLELFQPPGELLVILHELAQEIFMLQRRCFAILRSLGVGSAASDVRQQFFVITVEEFVTELVLLAVSRSDFLKPIGIKLANKGGQFVVFKIARKDADLKVVLVNDGKVKTVLQPTHGFVGLLVADEVVRLGNEGRSPELLATHGIV